MSNPTYKLKIEHNVKEKRHDWSLLWWQPDYTQFESLFEYVQQPSGYGEYVEVDSGRTRQGRLQALTDAVVARERHKAQIAAENSAEVIDFDGWERT